MGVIDPRRVELASGGAVVVRSAVSGDAAGLVALERDQILTDPHRIREPDEGVRDEAAWVKRLAEVHAGPRTLTLVAEAGGNVLAGRLQLNDEPWWKLRHHASFGVLVHSSWRGRGVGGALIAATLDWAAAHPELERIRLSVLASNVGARRLYRRLGFRTEGRLRRHFAMRDGRVIDDVLMAIYVKPGVAPEGFQTWRGVRGATR